MLKRKTANLDQLRAAASDKARAMLDRIWDYYCERREGMPALVLHSKFGGKAAVRSAFAPLGGTVVRADWENGKDCYRVTLLGILVSGRGLEAEDLMVHYLEYVRERYQTKPEDMKITSAQLEDAFGLSPEQSYFLSQLFIMSIFSGSGSPAQKVGDPWNVEFSTVIEDAPPTGDLRGFFRTQVMEMFDPDVPVSAREQMVEVRQADDPDAQPFWRQASAPPHSQAAAKRPDQGTIVETTFGRYTLGRLIGEGGAGRVFEAVDEGGEKYAIKLLDPQKAKGDKRRRFKNEIQFGVKNDHKNIIRITDHGLHKDGSGESPFYVMPFYKSTLRKLMNSGIPTQKVLPCFTQLLDGVEAAHFLEVFHRDLKPENVLYDPDSDRLVVADFGIAQFNQEELYTLVETGAADRLANFQYAAPEQRQRGQPADHRADIYALGLILNELFTGEIPQGSGHKIIASVAPEYAYLDELIERMRRQSPAERPASIGQIKQELIARRNDFVSQQRLSGLRKTVVPESELDDPLILNPIRLVGADYDRQGQLILQLSQPINDGWAHALRNFGSHTSVLGKGPESFSLRGPTASIPARENDVQDIINYFKEWLPRVNQRYKEMVISEKKRLEEEARQRLLAKIAEEERIQRIRSKIQI